jgi:hypothetical protein
MFADQLVDCVRNAKYNFVDHEGCEGVDFCVLFEFLLLATKDDEVETASKGVRAEI